MPSTSFSCPNCGQRVTPNSSDAVVVCPGCRCRLSRQSSSIAKGSKDSDNQPTQSGDSDVQNEFRITCGKCSKSIRVPAKLAGRKGACPRCHTIFVIPHAGAPVDNSSPVAGKPRSAQGEARPKRVSEPQEPILDELPIESDDPLRALNDLAESLPASVVSTGINAPYPSSFQPQPKTRGRKSPTSILVIKICGIALLVLACGNAVFHTAVSGKTLMMSSVEFRDELRRQAIAKGKSIDVDKAAPFVYMMTVVMLIVMLGVSATIAYGGFQMFRQQQWGVALAAAILAVIPCVCYTAILTTPLGILSIVMLCKSSVRAEFKRIAATPPRRW